MILSNCLSRAIW